jgi:hypothetical protein
MKKLLIASFLLLGCGSGEHSETKIVGGFKTYQQFYGKVGGCGSTLIKKRWAISAAHCFGKSTPSHVTFGLFKRGDPKNGGKPMDRVPVKRVIKHPSWDLALIELKRPSKFKPLAMHEGRDPPDGYRLQTYGFGNTAWQSGAPDVLQGTVLVFNETATKNARKQIIRAGEKGKAVCHGDSGGPLVYNDIESDNQNTKVTPKLIATTTFTVGKCKPGALMGFTRLDIPWIKKYIL